MALDLEGQPLQTSRHSLLGERVLVAPCLRKEAPRIWISLLETRRWLQRVGLVREKSMIISSVLITVGYGIHYPVRHGQVENWVFLYDLCAGTESANACRITWNASGPIQFLNTFASNRRTITSYSQNLYVLSPCSSMPPLTINSH